MFWKITAFTVILKTILIYFETKIICFTHSSDTYFIILPTVNCKTNLRMRHSYYFKNITTKIKKLLLRLKIIFKINYTSTSNYIFFI